MTIQTLGQPYTVEDLDDIPPDGHRYELIDGSLLVTPAPNLDHQRCVILLGALLLAAETEDVRVVPAPFDWVAGHATLFQPDLLVARATDFTRRRLEKAPLLAVEIHSPSTKRIDVVTKRSAYAEAGVMSYWLVDPDVPSVTVLRLEGTEYSVEATVSKNESFTTEIPVVVTLIPSQLVR